MKTTTFIRMGILPVLALLVFACKKDVQTSSNSTSTLLSSQAKTIQNTNLQGPAQDWSVAIEATKNECNEQVFTLTAYNQNGKPIGEDDGGIAFTISDANGIVESYTGGSGINITTHLDPGNYNLNATVSTGSNLRGTSVPQSIEVKSCECTPALTGSIINAQKMSEDEGKITYKLTLSINIQDCGHGYAGKLQGGLVNGAQIQVEGTTPGYSYPNPSNASVIKWEPANANNYQVTYLVTRTAGHQDVTGDWKFSYDGGELTFEKLYFDFE